MYRKYPIWASSSHIFTNGVELPQSLITSAQISTLFTHSAVCISQIYINDSYINITLIDGTTQLPLGCFSGNITEEQQVLQLQAFNATTAGSITIGVLPNLSGMYRLTPDNGRLEPSTVYCFTPPTVTSINHNGNKATNAVKLVGNNINLVDESGGVKLTVTDPSLVLSHNSFSSVYANCSTPVIEYINTVPPNSLGNIDLYGISPVTLAVDAIIEVSLGNVTLADVCPERALVTPPTDSGHMGNDYLGDILSTTTTEWQSWPQLT